jgi:cytochrome c biogenesis protein CcdA
MPGSVPSARNVAVSDGQVTPGAPEVAPTPGELIELVKGYAIQETIEPIKGAGRWLAFGAAGAFVLGLGFVYLLLGLLRLLQTETDVFDGAWNWVPYAIVLVACVGVLLVTLSRVNKKTLAKE